MDNGLLQKKERRRAELSLRDAAFDFRPSQAVLQPPWPLQAFWPLQPFLSVLQAPWPLQSFWPLQACLLGVVAVAPAGAAVEDAEEADAGSGVLPAQPTRIPPTAAARIAFVIFMVLVL